MENYKQIFFFFLKKARHKLYFTARMLLANSCGISFASTKILNKERIGWLFKNKIGFYFGLGGHKTTNKKTKQNQITTRRAACLLCVIQRRKWLPAGSSMILG